MNNSLAAANCPACPSDSARWAPLFALSDDLKPTKVLTGDLFQCLVCSLRWVAVRGEGEPYIPDDEYWNGHEFD